MKQPLSHKPKNASRRQTRSHKYGGGQCKLAQCTEGARISDVYIVEMYEYNDGVMHCMNLFVGVATCIGLLK